MTTDINRNSRQRQRFPIKLNDDLRHKICFRIALGFTTRQVQSWLDSHRIKIGYQGLRKYWKRRRWVKLTNSIKANIVNRPEVLGMIKEILQTWLDGINAEFKDHATELKNELRAVRDQDPSKVYQFNVVGIGLVQKFNEALEKGNKMAMSLRNTEV